MSKVAQISTFKYYKYQKHIFCCNVSSDPSRKHAYSDILKILPPEMNGVWAEGVGWGDQNYVGMFS